MGYEAGTRHLQGVQHGYKVLTRHTRQVQDTYKEYKAGTRHLQGVQCNVQDTYKGYEAVMRHLDGKAATLWKNEYLRVIYVMVSPTFPPYDLCTPIFSC